MLILVVASYLDVKLQPLVYSAFCDASKMDLRGRKLSDSTTTFSRIYTWISLGFIFSVKLASTYKVYVPIAVLDTV